MWNEFVNKLAQLQETRKTDIAFLMNPKIDRLPLPVARFDDPFLPFGKAVINATQHMTCAYVFDFASYLALGAAGAVALERTLRYVGQETIKILHGPFVGGAYSAMADKTAFDLDALTIVSSADLHTYLQYPPYGAFLIKDREIDYHDAATQGGILWVPSGVFTLLGKGGLVMKMRLTNDKVLYGGRGDDYIAQIQKALERLI